MVAKDSNFKTRAQGPQVRLVRVGAEYAGQRLDNFLIRFCKGVPKSHLYKAIRAGQVRINKARCKPDSRLQAADLLRIPPFRLPEPGQRPSAPPAQFPILYEDQHLLVVDKPAGVAVHGGSGVSFGVIEQLRAARPDERMLELAHRLDRETSGILILARSRKALVALHEMFRAGLIQKHYYALVVGDWHNQRQHIRAALYKYLTPAGERRVRVDSELGKPAHSVVSLQQRLGGRYSLLDVQLCTGRTHQIRVHLAHLGYPIAGDDKYGPDHIRAQLATLGFKRMFLHAHSLTFAHPVGGQVLELRAPLPPACEQLLLRLQA